MRVLACASPSIGAVVGGLVMIGWGVVAFVWREPLFRLSMWMHPFAKEGCWTWMMNRALSYVAPFVFGLVGIILAIAGLLGAAC